MCRPTRHAAVQQLWQTLPCTTQINIHNDNNISSNDDDDHDSEAFQVKMSWVRAGQVLCV